MFKRNDILQYNYCGDVDSNFFVLVTKDQKAGKDYFQGVRISNGDFSKIWDEECFVKVDALIKVEVVE